MTTAPSHPRSTTLADAPRRHSTPARPVGGRRLTPQSATGIIEKFREAWFAARLLADPDVARGFSRRTFAIAHDAFSSHREWHMAAPSQRRLDIDEVGDVTVARFIDKKILDENNIQIIGNQMFGLVEEDGRKKIVLDFTNVEYLSSAALGKLITMDKKVKAAGGKLRLCNIRKDIYEVFAITRLNKVFDIRNTQEEAIAAM
jgi:anti-sigma B factor antagonist